MEKSRKSISRAAPAACLLTVSLLLVSGCATIRRARAVDPLSPAERINLGVTYEQDGKADPALREYRRAERGNMRAAALVYQANLHASQGEPALAERSYRKALKIDPDQLMALNNLAWLLAQENRKLDEAESLIRHALTLHPEPRAPYENTLETVLERKEP